MKKNNIAEGLLTLFLVGALGSFILAFTHVNQLPYGKVPVVTDMLFNRAAIHLLFGIVGTVVTWVLWANSYDPPKRSLAHRIALVISYAATISAFVSSWNTIFTLDLA